MKIWIEKKLLYFLDIYFNHVWKYCDLLKNQLSFEIATKYLQFFMKKLFDIISKKYCYLNTLKTCKIFCTLKHENLSSGNNCGFY